METSSTERSKSSQPERVLTGGAPVPAEPAAGLASGSENQSLNTDTLTGGLATAPNLSPRSHPVSSSDPQPLADGNFSSVGPDSAVFNRYDQPTLVGLLLFASLCIIGWSVWQWMTIRTRTIDIDQVRRTELRFEVDLNLAPAAEFANLPGVGPKLAEEIVAYRQQIGGFHRFEELLNVSGIGEAKYKAILPFLRQIQPPSNQPKAR